MTEVVRLAHRARHLGAFRRVLCVPELHCQEFLGRFAARIQRAHGGCRIAFEDLCHDGMATGICVGARGGSQRNGETAEPVDFESDFDCAEGRGRGAEGTAAMRRPRCGPNTSTCATTWLRACERSPASSAHCRKARSMPIPTCHRSSGRGGVKSASDLAGRLLREAHVATVPGEGFGTRRPHSRFLCDVES